jgi:hypothetical protein
VTDKSIVVRTLEERIEAINARRKQLKVDLQEHLDEAASKRTELLTLDKQVGDLRAAIAREIMS